MLRVAGLPLLLCLLAACGGAAPPAGPSEPLHTPRRLYPLAPGNIWTYDVDTGVGVPTLAITRVKQSALNRFEVSSGSEPLSYEVREGGIYNAGRDAWLLKAPIEVGAGWPSGSGMRAEVTALDKSMSTPAGDFRQCVEVLETGGDGAKRIRTVYCPDVGPVLVESSMAMELSGKSVRVQGTLRGYTLGLPESGG